MCTLKLAPALISFTCACFTPMWMFCYVLPEEGQHCELPVKLTGSRIQCESILSSSVFLFSVKTSLITELQGATICSRSIHSDDFLCVFTSFWEKKKPHNSIQASTISCFCFELVNSTHILANKNTYEQAHMHTYTHNHTNMLLRPV